MKNFNEIYQKLYNEYHEEMENIHQENSKKSKKKITITIILLILSILISMPILTIVLVIYLLILLLGQNSKFKAIYKDTIISSLVHYYDSSLTFDKSRSISSMVYKQAEFEKYDEFYSDDYISGKIDGIIDFAMGDVHTIDVSTDSDGHTTRTTIFRGLFSSGNLDKTVNGTIKMRSDKGFLGKFFSDKTKMSMDSGEFEKHFDVYATDKILAMRIFTSDIMDFLISFKTQNKIKFELTIKNNNLFVRIHCGNMFEGSSAQKALDFETLYKYFKFLDFMCELNKKIYYVLQEKDL